MSGTVLFSVNRKQAEVLTKLSADDCRLCDGGERMAFYSLVRRGLARGSIEEGSARLTRRGWIAAMLAAELLERPRRAASPDRAMTASIAQ